jgi:uncharacterized membrane protein
VVRAVLDGCGGVAGLEPEHEDIVAEALHQLHFLEVLPVLAIASIPGLGTIYKSFRRMGDVMLGEDGENFQEVKLVECFGDDVFVLGFKTSDSPPTIEDSANQGEMVSMFLPLAPNPVTGGFLTYVPKEDVHDVDMTVEEGVRSILTSGVATAPERADSRQLGMDDVEFIGGVESLTPGSDGDEDGT